MKINELKENPDNPSKCSEEQLQRLVGKLRRVPLGLTALRIAYIRDDDGTKTVLSGNKRLRALKIIYGEDAELPDEYFQDITSMSETERHEFILTANVQDGEWDLDRLLEQYGTDELAELLDTVDLEKVFSAMTPPPEPPCEVEAEDERKPFVVKITFQSEKDTNEFLESVQADIMNKYHAFVNVSGGGL